MHMRATTKRVWPHRVQYLTLPRLEPGSIISTPGLLYHLDEKKGFVVLVTLSAPRNNFGALHSSTTHSFSWLKSTKSSITATEDKLS